MLIQQANGTKNILHSYSLSDKKDFKPKLITRAKEGHYV